MGRRTRTSKLPKASVGRLPLAIMACLMLLSCERNPAPQIPPGNPPKPQTGAVQSARDGHGPVRSAVYTFTGRPLPMYRPEAPIPVHKAPVRT